MIDVLGRASVDGALAAIVVWLICRVGNTSLSASTKTWLWWCVAARFVLALVWISPVALPLLPAPPAPGVIAPDLAVASESFQGSVDSGPATSPVASRSDATGLAGVAAFSLLSIWLVGVGGGVAVGLSRWWRARHIVRSSAPAPPDLANLAAMTAHRLGLRCAPRVRVSAVVETPLVVGIVRPTVILPTERFDELDPDARAMALAHECAHVRRHDLRFGCLAALTEAIFFFHPLARLAAHEYALWREAACDAVVLDALDAPPERYGRLLLQLGVSRPRVQLAAAGASWSTANLKRRLLMLNQTPRRPLFLPALALAAVVLVVPMRLVARDGPQQSGPRPAVPAPAVSVPMAPAPALPAVVPQPGAEIAPVPAVPAVSSLPTAGRAPAAAAVPQNDARGFAFVLIRDDGHRTMNGSSADGARAERFARPGEPLLWFRSEGHEYIVRDRDVIRQVDDAWRPVTEIGQQQGKIGERQGELGLKQAEVGKVQAEVGAAQHELAVRQAEIAVLQAQANLARVRAASDETRQDAEAQQAETRRRMQALEEQMTSLSAKMSQAGTPMRELGSQMNELGRQMRELGERMKTAAEKAQRDTRAIAERAIASGAAQPVK